MRERIKHQLRQSSFVVTLVRFSREITLVWKQVRDDYQNERESHERLEAREKVISHYFQNNQKRKLQIGAGGNPLPGWLNTDLEPTNNQIVYLDAMEPFPFADQEFDYVFSEHMIEHIHYKAGVNMLHECFRILKPGGKIRIATPDVERLVGLFSQPKTTAQRRYIEWSMTDILGLYNTEKSVLQKRRPEWDIDKFHFTEYFPQKDQDGVCFIINNFFRSYGHQFLYDKNTLQGALESAGFKNICQANPNYSDDENFRNIESHDNVIGEEMNQFETLILEGVRPF